jgi:PBP1b-binding outer membrane lipoprotein LpoB
MKKVFAIAALAAVLVSCDDAKKTGEEVKAADTTATSTATEVAAAAADTTIKTAIDTTKAPDSLKK